MADDDTLDFDKTADRPREGSAPAALAAGTQFGQYRIIRLLGRGGMGEVYEAEHRVLELRYALKLLPPDFAGRPGALQRFEREAKVMANLEHPNIIRVDDFGETDGRYWLRMELAAGAMRAGKPLTSLADYAEAHGGKIGQHLFAGMLEHILDGLAYAHERGVVHRDLKPANILLVVDAAGETLVKVADFGLVKLVGEEWLQSQAQISVDGSPSIGEQDTVGAAQAGSSTRSLLGTYEYMSPEQKRGEEADERSDVYSIGLMTFRLLTGRTSPGLRTPSQIDRELVPAWDDLALRALEEDPAERYRNVNAVLAQLSEIHGALGEREAGARPADVAEVLEESPAQPEPAIAHAEQQVESTESTDAAVDESATSAFDFDIGDVLELTPDEDTADDFLLEPLPEFDLLYDGDESEAVEVIDLDEIEGIDLDEAEPADAAVAEIPRTKRRWRLWGVICLVLLAGCVLALMTLRKDARQAAITAPRPVEPRDPELVEAALDQEQPGDAEAVAEPAGAVAVTPTEGQYRTVPDSADEQRRSDGIWDTLVLSKDELPAGFAYLDTDQIGEFAPKDNAVFAGFAANPGFLDHQAFVSQLKMMPPTEAKAVEFIRYAERVQELQMGMLVRDVGAPSAGLCFYFLAELPNAADASLGATALQKEAAAALDSVKQQQGALKFLSVDRYVALVFASDTSVAEEVSTALERKLDKATATDD